MSTVKNYVYNNGLVNGQVPAIEWTGDNAEAIKQFLGNHPADLLDDGTIKLTSDDDGICELGDYIVKGLAGVYHVVKADVFPDAFDEV